MGDIGWGSGMERKIFIRVADLTGIYPAQEAFHAVEVSGTEQVIGPAGGRKKKLFVDVGDIVTPVRVIVGWTIPLDLRENVGIDAELVYDGRRQGIEIGEVDEIKDIPLDREQDGLAEEVGIDRSRLPAELDIITDGIEILFFVKPGQGAGIGSKKPFARGRFEVGFLGSGGQSDYEESEEKGCSHTVRLEYKDNR
jgi:hypothetical protein